MQIKDGYTERNHVKTNGVVKIGTRELAQTVLSTTKQLGPKFEKIHQQASRKHPEVFRGALNHV